LERVLRETLIDEGRELLDSADKMALMEVAAHHRSKALSFDPVLIKMVQAVLLTHFQALSNSSEFWRTVSVQIGQTLWDDPVARLRLEALWRCLCAMEP
jgi:hypothetical protein